jgi:hypothetical protein
MLLLTVSPLAGFAADEDNKSDLALWSNLTLKTKPLANKWVGTLELEHRSRNNISATELFRGLLNMDYLISKHLTAGLGYEIYLNNEPDAYLPEHRYFAQGIYTVHVADIEISLRTRIMNTFKEWGKFKWENRNRFKLKYHIGNTGFKPFVYTEPYNSLMSDFYRLNKARYAIGCNYSFGNHGIDLSYMLEKYYTRTFNRHVVYACYIITF